MSWFGGRFAAHLTMTIFGKIRHPEVLARLAG